MVKKDYINLKSKWISVLLEDILYKLYNNILGKYLK